MDGIKHCLMKVSLITNLIGRTRRRKTVVLMMILN